MEQQFSPCRRLVVAPRGQLERGFTLVEVLIVISIIAILASISFAGVRIVQEKTRVAQSRTEVSQFTQAIDRYQTDEKIYPYNVREASEKLKKMKTIGCDILRSPQTFKTQKEI